MKAHKDIGKSGLLKKEMFKNFGKLTESKIVSKYVAKAHPEQEKAASGQVEYGATKITYD